ncbi:MAG: PAS domain S-box protein [Acidobacteriota bacterium]
MSSSLLQGGLLQAGVLLVESLFLAVAILLLFKGRHRFGLMPLAALLGCTQYLQTVLAATLYLELGDGLLVSPGSAVLFPAALLAVLLLYQQEGVPRARSLILGILLANVTLTVFSGFTALHLKIGGVANLLAVPEALFHINPRIFLAGTAVLLLDVLAVVVLFEILKARMSRVSAAVRLPLGLIIVLAFDSIVFSLLAFAGHPAFLGILKSQLISKTMAGAVYGLALFVFLRRLGPNIETLGVGAGSGTWAILTYRERFEILQRQKRAQEEAFARERSRSREALSVAESRFRTLFRSITDGLIVIDAGTGHIIEVNPALEQLSGFEAESLIGRSLAEVELLDAEMVGGINPPMSAEWEAKLRRQDGKVLDIEVRLVRFSSGSESTVALIVRDITRRKAAEQALLRSRDGLQQRVEERTRELQQSEARYRDLFENSHDLIQVVDGDGRFRFVNRSWKRALGYNAGETAELTASDILVPAERTRFAEFLARLVEGEEKGLIETEFVTKDGRTILVEGNVECSRGSEDPGVFRGIFRDVTERKAVEKLKDRFVETVSHELRTPLASVVGALDLVNGGKLAEVPPQLQKFTGVALRNARRLSWLINEILDFRRIESGRLELDLETFEIDPAIRQALEDNQAYAERYRVRLVGPEVPCGARVEADRGWLQQVMSNLLSNAVKHAPAGSEVTVTLEERDATVSVGVADRGPGIPEAFHDQVFLPFSQLQVGQKPEEGSSGLGLSIARMLIESMGGEIGFVTETGRGTTFTFSLPKSAEPAAASSQAEVLEVAR